MVIRQALKYGENNLSNCLYTDPINESRKILSFLMDRDISFFYLNLDYELPEEIIKKYIEILDKRKEGYPLQYIINKADFYGRDFYVDPRVLIPRWDTENLVEFVKKAAKNITRPEILEIGAGSGAISITIALEIFEAKVLGVDISNDALKVCEINLEKYGVGDRVRFVESNLFSNVTGFYDIIISNPPYIRKDDLINLQEEVKKEPVLALDGGEDGLDFYRQIASTTSLFLKDMGIIAFEIGHDQYEDVFMILNDAGFIDIGYKKDLQGYKRIIYARKGGK